MPGFSALASLGRFASTFSVRVAGSTRLSTALTLPVKVCPASASVVAAILWPMATRPEARSGTSKATVTVDMSSSVAMAFCELTRSPTVRSVRPMVPAKGACSVRLARSRSALRRSISAFWTAVLASLRRDGGDVARLCKLVGAVERGLRHRQGDLGLLDGDLLVGIIEAEQRLTFGHRAARLEGHLGDDAGDSGEERDGLAAATVPTARTSRPACRFRPRAVTTWTALPAAARRRPAPPPLRRLACWPELRLPRPAGTRGCCRSSSEARAAQPNQPRS